MDKEDGVRSQRTERRSAIVAKELKALGLDVVALTEVRKEGSGEMEEVIGGYTVFWKGVDEGIRNAGVGFAIRTKLIDRLEIKPVGISERLMYCRYKSMYGKFVTFICAYAPTMNASEVSKEVFYESLQKVVDGTHKDDVIMLMGDFNARVGSDYRVYEGCLGKHGVGKCNSNGELLLDFCIRNNLIITNTLFQHRNALKCTWQHPRSKHWHLLDYVITNQRHRSVVMDTRVMRSADCSSDHRLVRTRIKLAQVKKYRYRKPDNNRKKKINVESLKDHKARENFANVMDKVLAKIETLSEEQSLEQNWAIFRDTVYETSLAVLGTKKNRRNDWFDENDKVIQDMVESKRKAFKYLLSHDKNSRNYAEAKADYTVKKSELQCRVRQIKDEWWRQQAVNIQSMHDRHDIRGLFQSINKLCGPITKATQAVKDLDGNVIVDPKEILQRWTGHFHSLLNIFSKVDESVLENIPQREINEALAVVPTVEEVEKAIARLKNNKCSGEDGIPAEVFKHAGRESICVLHTIICQSWETGTVPQQWKDATIIKLFKKDDPMICGNYRGISLLAVAGKILSNIVLFRLAGTVEEVLPESQCGFRSERGTADMIFAVRQLQEKCEEQQMDLYMVFIDLTKAYDTVNRELLWKLLAKYGVPDRLIQIVRSMHDGMKAKLNLEVGVSDDIEVNNGLKQGCVMAPTLFNLFFAAVMFEAFRELPENSGIGIRIGKDGNIWKARDLRTKKKAREAFIKELCYADDCALVAHTQEMLQLFMTQVDEACNKFGLTISFKKTEVLKQATGAVNRGEKVSIALEQGELKVVDRFTYLGSTVKEDASLDTEISMRLKKAGSAFGRLWKRVWKQGDITRTTKIAVYKACILSILLYACQTWNMYQRHLQRLESFHHRCLRKILGISWQERIPTMEVLQMAELPYISTMVANARIKWLGHLRRMPDHRYPKMLLMAELMSGKRKQSKPKQRWKDKVRTDLRNFNMEVQSWWDVSADRPKWRKQIYDGAINWNKVQRKRLIEKRMKRKAEERKEVEILRRQDGFKCPNCERVFPVIASLRRHESQVHNNPRTQLNLECQECKRQFTSSSGLTRHKCALKARPKKEEPRTLKLLCPGCPRTFTTKSGLSRHKKFCQRMARNKVNEPDTST